MPYQPPPDPSSERRSRVSRWVGIAFSGLLIALVAYLGYVGYEGSRQLSDAPSPSTDCRTPASLGWEYEAINYDADADADLMSEPDPKACSTAGAAAGDVVQAGAVNLAGWYIPAGDGAPATGPTVVLAHGWGSNKSNMLDRAAVIHDRYNVLLFDFRNHGQSSEALTTQGVREADDLRAMIDWLEREKQPEAIAVLGVSMGGATALAEATRDDRVAAVVAESTHATLAHAAQARLDRGGYPLSMPGSWAVLLGSLIRTGEDVSAVDPISSARRLDERPLLVIHGALDASIGPGDADAIAAAAEEAGSPVELRVCRDGGHADVHEVCAEEYPGWVLGFLERVLGPAA